MQDGGNSFGVSREWIADRRGNGPSFLTIESVENGSASEMKSFSFVEQVTEEKQNDNLK